MHQVLVRQLKKAFGNIETIPKELLPFVQMVEETYTHYDEDRALTERAIELSSKELRELNEKLKTESEALKEKAEEAARMNKLMIGRELKMIDLKMKIAELQGVNPLGTSSLAKGIEAGTFSSQ